MRLTRHRGISLIDVMIVLAILAVMAVLLVPQYNQKKAREQRMAMIAKTRSDLVALKLAEEIYFERTGRFTTNTADLAAINPALADVRCPFDGEPYTIVADSVRLQISCSVPDAGSIDGGVPSWLSEPGAEELRASLILRSRERMGKIRSALEAFKAKRGTYTASLDTLETVTPGVKNLLCPLVMRRFAIVLSDTAGYEITSHLDEVGRILGGREEFPPLPKPKK